MSDLRNPKIGGGGGTYDPDEVILKAGSNTPSDGSQEIRLTKKPVITGLLRNTASFQGDTEVGSTVITNCSALIGVGVGMLIDDVVHFGGIVQIVKIIDDFTVEVDIAAIQQSIGNLFLAAVPNNHLYRIEGLYIHDGHLYAQYREPGQIGAIVCFRISQRGQIDYISSLQYGAPQSVLGYYIVADDNTLYATGGDNTSIIQVDISNKTNMLLTGTITDAVRLQQARALTHSGAYLYATGRNSNYLITVDKMTFSVIESAVRQDTDYGGVIRMQYYAGYLHMLNYNGDKYVIVDVREPLNPIKIGVHPVTAPLGLQVVDNITYISNNAGEIIAYDHSRKDTIIELGTIDLGGGPIWSLGLIDKSNILGVDVTQDSISMVSFTNPNLPYLIDSKLFSSYINESQDIDIIGDRAFVNGTGSHVLIEMQINGLKTPAISTGYIEATGKISARDAQIENNVTIGGGLTAGAAYIHRIRSGSLPQNTTNINKISPLPQPVGGKIYLKENETYDFNRVPINVLNHVVVGNRVKIKKGLITTFGNFEIQGQVSFEDTTIWYAGVLGPIFQSADFGKNVFRFTKSQIFNSNPTIPCTIFGLNTTNPNALVIIESAGFIGGDPDAGGTVIKLGKIETAGIDFNDLRAFGYMQGFKFKNCSGINVDKLQLKLGANIPGALYMDIWGSTEQISINNIFDQPQSEERVFYLDPDMTYGGITLALSPNDIFTQPAVFKDNILFKDATKISYTGLIAPFSDPEIITTPGGATAVLCRYDETGATGEMVVHSLSETPTISPGDTIIGTTSGGTATVSDIFSKPSLDEKSIGVNMVGNTHIPNSTVRAEMILSDNSLSTTFPIADAWVLIEGGSNWIGNKLSRLTVSTDGIATYTGQQDSTLDLTATVTAKRDTAGTSSYSTQWICILAPLYDVSFNAVNNEITHLGGARLSEGDTISFRFNNGSQPVEILAREIYYARNVIGSTFQISRTPLGAIVAFSASSNGAYSDVVFHALQATRVLTSAYSTFSVEAFSETSTGGHITLAMANTDDAIAATVQAVYGKIRL